MRHVLTNSVLVGSLVFGLAFIAVSPLAAKPQPSEGISNIFAQAQTPTAISGELTSRLAGKITIKDKEETFHSIKTTKETRVTVNSRPAKLDELQSGDQVLVTLEKDGSALDIAATRPRTP